MIDDTPLRAHTFIASLGADSAKELAGLLEHLAFQLRTGQLSVGTTGGPSSGGSYSYRINPEQTHERYFQEIEQWLAERKKEVSDNG